MFAQYHIEINQAALGELFGPAALAAINQANLRQDSLIGQIGHPEYHFDDGRKVGVSALADGLAFVDRQQQLLLTSLQQNNPPEAWKAFGRLGHAVQDFYAHSNYVALWREHYAQSTGETIQPLDAGVLADARLAFGKIYWQEALVYIPGMRPLALRLLPKDSHAWMNIDHPSRSPLFPQAMQAAIRRTVWEYEGLAQKIRAQLGQSCLTAFHG